MNELTADIPEKLMNSDEINKVLFFITVISDIIGISGQVGTGKNNLYVITS